MTCPHCGSEIAQKPTRQRSGQQNRYWHGVIVAMLAEHTGYTHDEMHDTLKAKFLGREDLGTGLVRVGSTKGLDVPAFGKLIDAVRLWAHTDLGVYIPEPNEVPESRWAA